MKETLLLLTLCAGLGCGSAAYAQDVRTRAGDNAGTQQPTQRTFSGRIVDEAGNPVVGATVRLIDRATGAVLNGGYTDAQGRYTVSTNSAATNLVVTASYVGLAELTVPAEANSSLTMKASDTQLAEVVVTGYGGQVERRNVTGAISTVTGDQIATTPQADVQQLLQGQAAGVQISSPSGKLGQAITVRVRGAASITAGNQPLYVVDGMIISTEDLDRGVQGEQTSPLALLNPADIENIQVLKDAQSAALYGSRASNGVVLITTKRGRAGKTEFNLNYYYGQQSPTRLWEFLDSDQFLRLIGEYFGYADTDTPQFIYEDLFGETGPYARNNWNRSAYNFTAPIQQIDFSARGGNEKTTFYANVTYFEQNGILRYNYLNRASGRLNMDHRINDNVKIGADFNITRTDNYRTANDNQFSALTQAVALWPIYNNRNAQGDFNTGIPYDNPFIWTENQRSVSTSYRFLSRAYAEISFLKNLTYTAQFNADILDDSYDQWVGRNASSTFSSFVRGTAEVQQIRIVNYMTTHFATYRNVIGDHNIDATGGFEFQRSREDYYYMFAEGFLSDDFRNIGSATTPVDVDGNVTGSTFISGFGRLNYRYKDRYLLGVAFRADASSRFGPDNRWGYFPGVSAGWILSEESFLENVSWLSLLKLRASWGLTGNAAIGNFTWRPLASTGFDYRDRSGVAPSQLGNTRLEWEKNRTIDAAIDFSLFNDRIQATVEYYNKYTTDLLLNVPIPVESGFNTILQNIGEVENKGWEFSLTTQNLTGDFKWTTNILWTINKNEVKKMGPDNAPLTTTVRGIDVRAQVGYSLGHYFGRRQVRVDPQNGEPVYLTDAGAETNNWNAARIEPLGDAYPTSFGSITNSFSYKGIDLSAMLYFNFGNSIYWGTGIYSSAGFAQGFDNQTVDQMNRWRTPGQVTDVPALGALASNGEPSSRLLYDGDFVRLRTVTLGYTLPQNIVSRVKLNRVRFYVQGLNLVTWTDYPGEPEISSLAGINNTGLVQGIDFYTVPQTKSWTAGVQIGF